MAVTNTADYWATNTEIIEEIAEIKGWSQEYTQNYWLNELTAAQRQEVLASYGFTATRNNLGTINGYVRNVEGTVQSAGNVVSGSAPQVMEVVESGENVAIRNLQETTTTGGTTIKAGGTMTAMKVVNGALIASVVGGAIVRDYKEHKEWWGDLSDAVGELGMATTANLSGGMVPYENDWDQGEAALDVLRVIQRRVEDEYGGTYYYSYLSANDLAAVMQMLAVDGAYDPSGMDYDDITAGYQAVHYDAEHMLEYAKQANSNNNIYYAADVGTMIPSSDIIEAYNHLKALKPNANATVIFTGGNTVTRNLTVDIYLFEGVTDANIQGSTGNFYISGMEVPNVEAHITRDYATQQTNITYTTNSRTNITIPVASNTDTSVGPQRFSNLGVTWVEGGIPEAGIEPDPNAIPFAIGSAATIAEVIQALQDQYPDWFGEGFSVGTYDPETNIFGDEFWLPVSIPWTDPNTAPYNTPEGYTQGYGQSGKPYPNPDTTPTGYGTPYPYPWTTPYTAPTIPYYFPNNPTPLPNDTPSSPNTPPVVTGSSNALWAVYNPTFSEVSAVGSYLWSSSIIDIIQKFFSNPMDAIISLHMIYTTPTTGSSQNIKLGYLDSGVSAKTVTNQYKFIDCGEILVPEYFQDVRDYSPYTKCAIFLPFIGIRSLATEDVINCKLRVKYSVDVLTGAILAELYITKRGATQCLYTFAGNGAVQIPLTGGDRTRLLSGIIAGATSVVGGAAIGGLAGAAAGAVHGVSGLSNSSSVERTGNFSANAGAMGIKKPYLIINRKDAYDASSYNRYYGFPCNIACTLGTCSGYTKVNSVHVNIPRALEEEKSEIEAALRSGVVIR